MTKKSGVDLSGLVSTESATTAEANAQRIALTLRVDQELYEKLTLEAARQRRKKQDLMEAALRAYLSQDGA